MRKYSRLMAVLLAVAMLLPGIAGAAPVTEAEEELITRLGGEDRIETSILASQVAYKEGADSVIITGFGGDVDALTGTLLAAKQKAPVLITRKHELSANVAKEIKRLGAKTVHILGGENVVHPAVTTELAKLKGVTVKRVAGENRNDTAAKVAKEVKGKSADHIFLAIGRMADEKDALADALAIGPVSAMKSSPVLLTKKDSLPAETKQAIKDLKVKNITIVGGTSAISKALQTKLEKDYKVDRVGESTREKTALAIADKYFQKASNLIVAYGRNSADALVGGYLGKLKNAPILLTNKNGITAETKTYIEDHTLNTLVLGGKTVVPQNVFDQIIKALKTKAEDVELDIEVDKDIKLDKDYNSVKVTGKEIVVDLNGKTVKTLTITGNANTIKNGTILNIVIADGVEDVILEDIIDDGKGNHDFGGGGAEFIVLKGSTNLKSTVNITSKAPIQIRAEGLKEGKGLQGKVTIDTDKAVTIGVPTEEIQVIKENNDIKLDAKVGKVVALANTKLTVAKDIETPKLEKAKGVTAWAKDSAGVVKEFVENNKLEAINPGDSTPPSTGGSWPVRPTKPVEKIEINRLEISTDSINPGIKTDVIFRYKYDGKSNPDFYLLKNLNGVLTPYKDNIKEVQLKDDGNQDNGDLLENDGIYSRQISIEEEEGYLDLVVGIKKGNKWEVVSTKESIFIVDALTETEVATVKSTSTEIQEMLKKPDKSQEEIKVEVIEHLNKNDEIKKVEASESGNSVWYTFKSGVLAAVSLEKNEKAVEGLKKASLFKSQNQSVKDNKSANINVGNPVAAIFASHGNTKNSELETALKNKNFIIKSFEDEKVTVEEFKKISEYGTIVFNTKGESLFKGNLKEDFKYLNEIFADEDEKVIISTGEKVKDESMKKYNADLKTGRLVIVDDYFAITSAFIEHYTKGQGKSMPDTLVYANTNQSMHNQTMAKTFINNGAQTYIGYEKNIEDNELVNSIGAMLDGESVKDVVKKGKIYGNEDLLLTVNQKIINGSLEDGLNGWIGKGHIDTITKLGRGTHKSWHTIRPTLDKSMGIISSGVDEGALDGRQSWIYQTFTVPKEMTNLKFDYNIVSSEPMVFIGSQFDDKFKATIVEGIVKEPGEDIISDNESESYSMMLEDEDSRNLDNEIQSFNLHGDEEWIEDEIDETWLEDTVDENEKIIGFESINSSDWGQDFSDDRQRVDTIFPNGDETTYMTGWKTVNYDVREYQGKTITLKLQVWDLGDTQYPTAVLFDNVHLTKSIYTGVGIKGRTELQIPNKKDNLYSYEVGKIDQYGDMETGEITTFNHHGYITPIRKHTANIKIAKDVDGVSIDEETGLLKVSNTAKVGEITLIAYDGNGNEEKLIVKLNESEPSKFAHMSIMGLETIKLQKNADLYMDKYTTKIFDQYGDEMLEEYSVKWSLVEAIKGVSIDKETGELSINPKLIENKNSEIQIQAEIEEIKESTSLYIEINLHEEME